MKRLIALILLLCLCCTVGCSDTSEINNDTVITSSQPVTPTPMPHSAFYIENLSVEDVIIYINEICLDAEITNSGNPNVIQKWMTPIYYALYGEYTQEDLNTLSSFVVWLNGIEGFPGMYPADEMNPQNLRIYFCDQQAMIQHMGDAYYGMDGAVTFWYENDEIYDAIICYRTEINQFTRNSVILEEIYNGLGPVQDTALRSDSIVYAEFSEPQTLTEIDELILKLLYHPEIQCGMNAEQCEAVIRKLYY